MKNVRRSLVTLALLAATSSAPAAWAHGEGAPAPVEGGDPTVAIIAGSVITVVTLAVIGVITWARVRAGRDDS